MKHCKKISLSVILLVFLFSCSKELHQPGNLVPKTVDEDPSLPAIVVNQSMLHSEAFGPSDSTLIICIHGGPGGDYRYLLNCKDLANNGYRVVFYDQRGSGLSQRFSGSTYGADVNSAMQILYNELSEVIRYYRRKPTQKVILLGHSWGAMLATAYAGKYPTAIQGLILCEPGGLKWNDVVTYSRNSVNFNIWSEFLNDVTYLDQFITPKQEDHILLDYKVGIQATENVITNGESADPLRYWRNGAVVNATLFQLGAAGEPDFSEGIEQFQAPVLFVYSEHNKAYPASWAEHVSAVYTHPELFNVSGAGHSTMISNTSLWQTITLPKFLKFCQTL